MLALLWRRAATAANSSRAILCVCPLASSAPHRPAARSNAPPQRDAASSSSTPLPSSSSSTESAPFPPPPVVLPSLKSFPASNAHASEAFRELDLILKSTEPRERVWSQLEAFVMDELARSLDACFTASTANVAAELRALVAIAGAGSSAAARRALALPMPGRSQHSDSASPSDPLYADADDDDPLLAAHRAETAFGAALSASVSSTAAPIARGTQRELFDALAKSQVRRAHVEALRALTREWAAARQFHRIADMYHRFFHAIDMNAIAMQLDGANAGAVAPLCRALISSVLLPTAVVSELGSPFSLTYDSILPRANGGACMDAHVFLPPDVFAPSVIDDAKTIVDAAWVSPQQFTHLNRLSAADKVQLGLKFARVFAHQAKLASLHAYCRDRSNSAIQASFRDSPAVHTELSAMEAASAQVEQWLRHPSEFSARLAGLDSASAPSNQNLGDPRGLTASRTALESAATPTARPDDFESFLSASMNAPELDTADASDASVVDSTIAPRANAGVAPPMVYSAALRWAQRRLSDPEAVRSIADARKKDVFAFVNRLGAVLTSAKENDFRHRRQATVALLDGNHGDGDGVDASADQAPVAQTSSIPAQSLLAAMRVAADELDVLSLVSLKVMSDLTSNTLLSLNRIGVSVGFPQWVSAFELAMRIGDFDKAHRLIAMEQKTSSFIFSRKSTTLSILILILLQRLPLLEGQYVLFFGQFLDAVVDAVTLHKSEPEAPNEMHRARLVVALETMRSTLTRMQSASMSSRWLRAAVAATLPAETISQFVHSQHCVDSRHSRILCDEWLHLSLKLLPELSAGSNFELDHSDLLDTSQPPLSSNSSSSSSSSPERSDVVDVAFGARTVLGEIEAFEDDDAVPVGGQRSNPDARIDSLPHEDASSHARHTSPAPAVSDLGYPIALLRAALTAMHALKIGISRDVLTSLANSLKTAGLFLPALHLVHANLQNSGALPSGRELEAGVDARRDACPPVKTDYIGIVGNQTERPRPARDSSPAAALSAVDEDRLLYVRFATSLFARHMGTFHGNGGFVSALYQMAEAASLRLSPRPVLDRVNAAARLALRLPPPDRSPRPSAYDAMHSVRAWSARAQSPLLWSADTKSVSYAQYMLMHALDAAHSDQNAILSLLHRLRIWESVRANTGKSRILFRNATMTMIAGRDLLHAAWPDLDVDAPRSMFAILSADSLSFGPINVLGLDFGFVRSMIWAFRRRGESSRAIASFGFFIDKINESLAASRTPKTAPRRPLFLILESMASVLLTGGVAPYDLRDFPRALVEFLTRWVHVLERGAEPDSDRLGLEGLDLDACARVFASTATLHAHVKSDVLFDVMIGSMRTLLVSNALQSLSMPHHSLARATSRLFLDLCRHAHTVASRWFYVLARYPNADASNGFVLTAPSVMSNFMFVMHGRLPGAFIALPFLQIPLPRGKTRGVKRDSDSFANFWRTHAEYLLSISGSVAFAPYRHLIDRRTDGSHSAAAVCAQPARPNASLALSFSLHESLQSIHPLAAAAPSPGGASHDQDALTDGIVPPPSILMEANDAQSANAILDMHYLRSPESGLLALCLHLRAIQSRTAVLRANHAASADADTAVDAAALLGFRSLTILCGRGANASPQGYSLLRLVLLEALVRVGLAPFARATVSMTIGADRSVASVVDTVTIESADLWRWCAVHADRRVTLEWLRPTL